MILPGAASVSLAPVLSRPVRTVTVTASLSRALYLSTGDPDIPALCLVAADAARVPCALVLGTGVAVPTAAVGSAARIGEGRVEVGGSGVAAVTRWWRPARPPVYLPQADARQRALHALSTAPTSAVPEPMPRPSAIIRAAPSTAGTVGSGAAEVAASALAATLAGNPGSAKLASAVRALLGLGDGLTPWGDDVLAGALVTLVGANHPAGRMLGSMVSGELAARPGATTVVSAALLVHATRGECIPELAAVLTEPVGRLGPVVAALLRVGHSSGGGLLHGVRMGLTVLTEPRHALHQITGGIAE